MNMIKQVFYIIVALMVTTPVGAISIIGNRFIEDQNLGFRFPIIGEYIRFNENSRSVGLVTVFNKVEIIDQFYMNRPVEIQVQPFHVVYPSWAELSREEIRKVLASYGWSIEKSTWSCADIYVRNNGQSFNYIAVWGEGRGIFMTASLLSIVNQNMSAMIDRLEIFPGACSWK